MEFYNTTTPYKELEHKHIQYTVCRDFSHICRYKGLRQIVYNPYDREDRFIALERMNDYSYAIDTFYYEVPAIEENRLDLIANKFLGSATYSWVIAYINHIEDGFSVHDGQRIKIPKSLFSLFGSNQILAAIPAIHLNLGSE